MQVFFQNFLKKIFLKFSLAFYPSWSIILYSESRHPLLDRMYSSSFSLDTGSLHHAKALMGVFVFYVRFHVSRALHAPYGFAVSYIA